jgi:hypothetical protein
VDAELVGDAADRAGPVGRVLAGLDRQTRRALTQFVGVLTGSRHDQDPSGSSMSPSNPGRFSLAVLALVVQIVKRSDGRKGFVVLPKRWIVERTNAWLMRTRRLARDYERRTTSAEAIVYWSMTLLMTRRLGRSHPSRA